MKKTLTLSVDEKAIKKIKKIAIDKNEDVSELFENWVNQLWLNQLGEIIIFQTKLEKKRWNKMLKSYGFSIRMYLRKLFMKKRGYMEVMMYLPVEKSEEEEW